VSSAAPLPPAAAPQSSTPSPDSRIRHSCCGCGPIGSGNLGVDGCGCSVAGCGCSVAGGFGVGGVCGRSNRGGGGCDSGSLGEGSSRGGGGGSGLQGPAIEAVAVEPAAVSAPTTTRCCWSGDHCGRLGARGPLCGRLSPGRLSRPPRISIRVAVLRPQRGGGGVVVNGNGCGSSSALTRPTERRVQ